MKRKLSVIEHIVFKKFKDSNIQFIFSIGIEGVFSLEELNNAIAKIRNKHPLLSKKVKDTKWTYFVPDQKSNLPVRVVKRIDDYHWLREERNELNLVFNITDGPLVRFVWLKGENKSEILFTVHHLIADGRAAGFVFRDIIYCLSDQNYKVKPYPFLPGISDLIPKVKLNLQFILRNRLKSLKALFRIKLNELKNKEYSSNLIEHKVNTNYTILHWSLSEKDSKILVKKASENKVTVQAVIHVALLEAFQKVVGKNVVPNIVKVPADIRHKLSDDLKSDSLGTSFAVPLSIDFQYKRRKDFWLMAVEVKKKLQEQLTLKNLYDDIIQLEYMKPVVNHLIKEMLNTDQFGKDELSISNIGNVRVRDQLGALKVNFFKASNGTQGKHHKLGVLVFDKKINFSLTYGSNDNSSNEVVVKIKENMIKSLEKALDTSFNINESLIAEKETNEKVKCNINT